METSSVVETSTTESSWFKILLFVASGFFFGFFIANAYYYHKIRSAAGCASVTQGQANAMFYFNLILALIAGLIFFYSAYILFVHRETRAVHRQIVTQGVSSGGYNPYAKRYKRYHQEGVTGFERAPVSRKTRAKYTLKK